MTGSEDNPYDEAAEPENHARWLRIADITLNDEAPEEEALQRQRTAERLTRRAEEEYINLRAREDAKRRWRAEQKTIAVPAPISLTELLAMPDDEVKWRIDDLWPLHGNIVLAAQYKAGKTTTVQNLIRSLVDGDRFLGIYPVEQVTDGCVMVTDFEMPPTRLKDWLRDQRIKNTDRVKLWALRGSGSAFDLLDETIRAQWVQYLAESDTRVWIVDCLGPILSALGLDESANKEVGRVLDALISVAVEAGVGEILLVHHMGHGAERSRGASRLRDWPDAEWRLVRQRDSDNPYAEPDPAAPRFFSAFGRDVDVREGQLVFSRETRRLVYADGNRHEAKASAAMRYVLAFVRDFPGRSGRAIEDAAKAAGENRNEVREARKTAVVKGYVAATPGEKRSELHTLTPAGFTYLGELAGAAVPVDDDSWLEETYCGCGAWVSPAAVASGRARCDYCERAA